MVIQPSNHACTYRPSIHPVTSHIPAVHSSNYVTYTGHTFIQSCHTYRSSIHPDMPHIPVIHSSSHATHTGHPLIQSCHTSTNATHTSHPLIQSCHIPVIHSPSHATYRPSIDPDTSHIQVIHLCHTHRPSTHPVMPHIPVIHSSSHTTYRSSIHSVMPHNRSSIHPVMLHTGHPFIHSCHTYRPSTYPVTHYVPATKPRMEAISRKSLLSMKKRSTPTTTQPTSTSRPMMPKARVARSSSARWTWN